MTWGLLLVLGGFAFSQVPSGFEQQADYVERRVEKFEPAAATPMVSARVEVHQSADGAYVLMRGGQPFTINGAGGTTDLALLKSCGGNTVRTWGVDQLEAPVDGVRLADRARDLGLALVAGIWLGHEETGFDYSDPVQLQAQRDAVRAAVRRYKNEPALLIWGLGNEMEGPGAPGDDPRIWNEVNLLAGIVKAEDPDHPVMTVIAGASEKKVSSAAAYAPNVDILGVNAYGSAGGVAAAVNMFGWKKPFVLTEFGPPGPWESDKTPWGAPLEANSTAKAKKYAASEGAVMGSSHGRALGAIAFLWGNKQEATSTWFGMFLPTGEKLGAVDEICHAWSGQWPADRAPEIVALNSSLSGRSAPHGTVHTATVEASDPDGDPLTYEWQVLSESGDQSLGGGPQSLPAAHPDCILNAAGRSLQFKAPDAPGAYRVFVFVRDGRGSAAAANFPFQSQ